MSNTPIVLAVKFPEMSLRGPRRLRRAAQWIKAEVDRGVQPVVVVGTRSRREERGRAMAGAGAIRGAVGARESDRARAAAQDLAASTLALALSALGVSARSLGVRDLELEGVGEFGAAVLHRLDAELVGRLVASRVTPVLPGGHVFRRDGEIVMLGNGGADLTAVVLAAALGTVPCHFLADRPGRLEPNVRRIHLEAVERARSLGVRIATRTFELGATLQAEERGASAIDAFTPPPGGPL